MLNFHRFSIIFLYVMRVWRNRHYFLFPILLFLKILQGQLIICIIICKPVFYLFLLRTLAHLHSELWLYEICLPLYAIDGNLLKLT